jgi:hypothetical protein
MASVRRGIGDADVARRVEQLRGPSFSPGACPSASQSLVSDVCFIIVDAEGNKILFQAVGKQGDDVAVLWRGGLAGFGRA